MGTSKNQEAASGAAVKKRGQFKEIWRRLKKNKMAMIGLGIVALLVLISIFADFLFDYNTVVIKQNTAIRERDVPEYHVRTHLFRASEPRSGSGDG